MEENKKYQLCISIQQQIITELRQEFSVTPTNQQFPPCVTYENGEYNYDLNVIIGIFAYYFKENLTVLQKTKENSIISFVVEVFKGIFHAKKNVDIIKNEKKFREEFQAKALEIENKYFNNPDKNSEYNLKAKIHEYNYYLNNPEYDVLDKEEIMEAFMDILKDFKKDMRELKSIRKNY